MWATFMTTAGVPSTFDNKRTDMAQPDAPVRRVCALLDAAKISYERVDHPAVYAIGEMDKLDLPHINDVEQEVVVLFDREIEQMPLVGVHPNQNTATVFLKPADLAGLIQGHDNELRWVDLP